MFFQVFTLIRLNYSERKHPRDFVCKDSKHTLNDDLILFLQLNLSCICSFKHIFSTEAIVLNWNILKILKFPTVAKTRDRQKTTDEEVLYGKGIIITVFIIILKNEP